MLKEKAEEHKSRKSFRGVLTRELSRAGQRSYYRDSTIIDVVG